MTEIIIRKTDGTEVFNRLRADWRELFAQTDNVPFLSREWLSCWHKYFGADKTPFVLQAFRDDRLIGILPLYRQERKLFGCRMFRRVGLLGDAHGGADYLDVIARAEDRAEVLTAMFDFLRAENSFDLLRLKNLATDSEIAAGARKTAANVDENSLLRYADERGEVCPQIDLAAGWEAVLKNCRRAENFKRALKKLRKISDFEIRSVTAPDEASAAFERFYQLHERRWAQCGGSDLSGNPRLAAFQRELVPLLAAAGLIRFEELWAAGECRASIYFLENEKTSFFYNSGYDLTWAKQSVGLVLLGLSIKNAAERGKISFDFLRGGENYKFEWANCQSRELLNIDLTRPIISTVVRQNVNQLRRDLLNFTKSVLPADLIGRLKYYRRAQMWNWAFLILSQIGNLAVEL